jgi:hypothetical protein
MAFNRIQNVWFDDAATSSMGAAFDRACVSLKDYGSAVPTIIAERIIAAAKNGERHSDRLYEQALKAFAIVDASMLFVSVGDPPSPPTLRSRTQRDLRDPVKPLSRVSLTLFWCVLKLPSPRHLRCQDPRCYLPGVFHNCQGGSQRSPPHDPQSKCGRWTSWSILNRRTARNGPSLSLQLWRRLAETSWISSQFRGSRYPED